MSVQQLVYSQLSGEKIDFQKNSKFVEEIVAEFDLIRQDVIDLGLTPKASDFKKLINKKSIRDCIIKHTGLNVDLGLYHGVNAGVYPPALGKNTVVATGFFNDVKITKGFKRLSDDNKKPVIISVDLKRGYVHGVRNIKTPILIGNYFLYKSSRHMASILFHEIGHLISMYYSFVSVSVPNFLLGEFTDRLFDIKDEKTRAILVSKIDKELPLKDQEAVLKAEDKEAVRLFLIDDIKRYNRSQFGNDFYDKRAWETMADNYVVKHGLYVELADVALNDFTFAENRRLIQFITFIFELVPPILLMVFTVAWLNEGGRYDDPIDRLKVIRKQAIAELKELNLEDAKERIEKIDKVTEIIGDREDFFSLGESLARLLIPSVKTKTNNKNTQKALEHFSHSEFNVLSTKLQQL